MGDNRPVRIKPAAGISCCICLNTTGQRVPAITSIRGYAVCDTHRDLASQPEFDIMLLGFGTTKRSGVKPA